jgi:hypothetical protein
MMDPATIATATVVALSPYLIEAAKGAGGKVGEAAYDSVARLFKFLKSKLTGGDEKALSRLEQEPQDADNQAALRVALKEAVRQDIDFGAELEALLKALPKTAASQSANVVGDNDVVVQAAGKNISTIVGDRK